MEVEFLCKWSLRGSGFAVAEGSKAACGFLSRRGHNDVAVSLKLFVGVNGGNSNSRRKTRPKNFYALHLYPLQLNYFFCNGETI